MRVVLGGTFEFLHIGHRALLEKAFKIGDEITIGITADGFKKGVRKNYEERKKGVEEYVKKFGKKYRIVKIQDIFGPTLEEDFDAIVVSEETKNNAEKINDEREKRNLKKMEIVTIPIFFAEDLLPVSSRRIRKGEINEKGKRMKKMIVKIGSDNPSKINAVKMIFEKLFDFEIEYIPARVDSGVPAQPFNDETVRGAINRAKKLKDYDYAIGIEAGLFWENEIEEYLDRAYCAIIDKYRMMSVGHSGGFSYPPIVIDMVKSGMEVGEAMEKLSGIEEIKKKMGAIGYLSKGIIKREEFNAQAVLMAMIPRIRGSLYFSSLQDKRIPSHPQ